MIFAVSSYPVDGLLVIAREQLIAKETSDC